LSRLKTTSVADKRHLVNAAQFARAAVPGEGVDVLETLPDVLGARTLRRLAARIVEARRGGKLVLLGFGGHVIKTGLQPLVVDLLERGFVTAVCTNGSGALHDFEIAAVGHSSEDVGPGLSDGSWGMVHETAAALNGAADRAARE